MSERTAWADRGGQSTGLPVPLAMDARLSCYLSDYRHTYLRFFLDRFDREYSPGYRGGFFNINSVTGRPYAHRCCYTWTDGRALAELAIAALHSLADEERLRRYADHLFGALLERYERNGYFPHCVADDSNLATSHPLNVDPSPEGASFALVFALAGILQYAMVFGDMGAWDLCEHILARLESALRTDRFLEGSTPRPAEQRAQGPFMISLGVVVDVLETMSALWGEATSEFALRGARFRRLGEACTEYILANHHRAADHAFWEVSQSGEPVRDTRGRVVTDPGHTIEFAGFAARFARFLDPPSGQALRSTCRGIFLWACERGFHPTRDLIYKNVDRETGCPMANERVPNIRAIVSDSAAHEFFPDTSGPIELATFPWWVPMELLAAGSLLRHGDTTARVDPYILRAVRGVAHYFRNDRIGGLCYQNIGDRFFEWVDIPPATPTLDLMHSHRSLRIFLRHSLIDRPSDALDAVPTEETT